MALTFIGETGLYLPGRDAIKITALDGDRLVDCFATRSALDAIGCKPAMEPTMMLRQFEKNRMDIEVAAMVKYAGARAPMLIVEVEAADLRKLAPPTAA
jgi:hypothetical protein